MVILSMPWTFTWITPWNSDCLCRAEFLALLHVLLITIAISRTAGSVPLWAMAVDGATNNVDFATISAMRH